jgi:hypothetical protein
MIFLTERYNFYRLLLRVNSKALPPGGRYAVPQSRDRPRRPRHVGAVNWKFRIVDS